MRTAPPGRVVNRRPIALGAVILVLAGCGTAAAHTSSPARPAAAVSATPAGIPPAACAGQMQAWLSEQAANAPDPSITMTNQDVITNAVSAADAYLHFAPNGNAASGQDFLMFTGHAAAELGSDIPACADPGQDISGSGAGSFITDATSCGQDTSQTPQATADCQAVTADLNAANIELKRTAPGVQITGGSWDGS